MSISNKSQITSANWRTKSQSLIVITALVFLVLGFILPFNVSAQSVACKNEGEIDYYKQCAEIRCCENKNLTCKMASELEIFGPGNSPSQKHAKCVKLASGEEIEPVEIPDSEPLQFKPQVTIPGSITVAGKIISFKAGEGIEVNGDLIAYYIGVFFKFFTGLMAVMAVVMVTWGGFKRIIAAGNAERISDSNDAIFSAIIGLVLTLISYTLLNLINPALLKPETLQIDKINREELEGDSEEQIVAGPTAVTAGIKSDGMQNQVIADFQLKDPLQKVALAMKARGYQIQFTSGWRDPEEQKRLIQKNCGLSGGINTPKSSDCRPGPETCLMKAGVTSCPHLTGFAVDAWGTKNGQIEIKYPPPPKTLSGYCYVKGPGYNICLNSPPQKALIDEMKKEGFCRLCSEPWHFELKTKVDGPDKPARGLSGGCTC